MLGAKDERVHALRECKLKLFHLEYPVCLSLILVGPGPGEQIEIYLLLNVTSQAHNLLNKIHSILLL